MGKPKFRVMKKFIFSFFGIILIHTLSAQNTLTGNVVDPIDETPVQFATVKIFASDSTLLGGGVSNELGVYEVKNLPNGEFDLSIKFIGYETYTQKVVIDGTTNPVTVPTIPLKRADALNAVEINADAAVFETKIDRKIYNADQNLTAKGGTAIDLMRQIPTITVDENNNILLRGDGNVTILIDGRPVAMPLNQLLPQLPATAIERVEIITNPSAKYDPEGMSGIINIILKKEQRSGFNGSVNGTVAYGNFPKYRGGVSMNYRSSKVNVSGSYNYNWSKIWFGGNQQRDVLLGDTLWDRLRQTDYGERINTSNNGQLGIDYFINDNNTIYASASVNQGTNLGSRDVFYNQVDNSGTIQDYSIRYGLIDAPSFNTTLNAGWQKTFKKEGHTLDLDVNNASTSFNADEDLRQEYFTSEDINYYTQYQNTLENQDFSTLIAKADYVLPISDSMIFEAGFHYTRREAGNDFTLLNSYDGINYVVDSSVTNHFVYLQQTFAPYTTLSRQFKKLGIKIGLRAEQTLTNSDLITTGESFSNDYFMLFPSAHFSYKINDFSELQLSYSKRINRPDMGYLNPFSNYSDPLTLQTGNPFLRPEVIHVNELSFIRFWKKFNLNTTVYYRLITDLIRRNLSFNGIYSEVSFTNLNNSHLSGGDLTLTYAPSRQLRIVSSTSLYMTSTADDELTNGEWMNYPGMNTSLMAMYGTKNGWRFQAWGSYSPKMPVIQGYILSNYGVGIGVQKSFFNNKLNANLAVMDILKTRRFAFESYDLGNYTFSNERRWESRRISLTLTYNFGKPIKGKTRRENNSTDASDDIDIPQMQ